jgi:hypothetical protein
MNERRRTSVGGILAALAALGFAGALAASSFFPEFYHVYRPVQGGWSTYRITDPRGESADLTFAVVGQEAANIWLELRTPVDGGEAAAAFLLSGDPSEDENVVAVRVQEPGGPAMEMDRATLERLRTRGQKLFGGTAAPIGPTFGKLEGLPDESVEVGGRALKCRHLRVVDPEGKSAEVWLNDDVVPFGIVRLVSGDDSVVLQAYGKGAKATVKGPFVRMDVP